MDPEADARRVAEADRPPLIAVRTPLRACITRWKNDYEKFLREHDRTVKPWGPDEYTWFDTLETKVSLKCAGLEALDADVLATYPVLWYAAEHADEVLEAERYMTVFLLLVNRCRAWAKVYRDMSGIVSTRLAGSATGTGGGTHVAGMPTTAKLQLPKQKTPTFDGDQIKWPEFWDRFHAIDTNVSLTDSQKLDYLKQCLTGPALATISFLETVDRNYLVAVDLLKESYNNQRKIVAAHLERCAITHRSGQKTAKDSSD
jgi:hypothetical protein